MFESLNQANEAEAHLLRKLRVWIAALAVVCVLTGMGIGAILAGRPAVAQNELQAAAPRAPEALSSTFVEIARRVEPAVVNIDTLQASELPETDNDDKADRGQSNPLYDMLRRQPPRPTRGVGSGFIIDSKGYIVTNQHVIDGATRITVGLLSGERYRATIVGVDSETDLAVLKIDAGHELPVMKLGDSNAVQVGDWVLAIGSPFGLEQTVTAGIISKKERDSQSFTNFQRFLQTDAAINRGNSGGPLVNMRGEAIGVNSQIATLTGDYNGIGFALPANETRFVCDQILASGKVKRGYLGVTLESVRGEFARVYSLPDARGAVIADIQPDDRNGQPTPATKAGFQVNDVIVEFNGQPVQDSQDLIGKIAGSPVGQTVSIGFIRNMEGKLDRRTVSVTLGERPPLYARDSEAASTPVKDATAKSTSSRLGLTLGELTPQLIADKHLSGVKGLYVKEVDPNGLAADTRNEVQVGEVITRINRIPITTLAEFERVVNSLKPGDAIVLNLSSWYRLQNRISQRIVQFTYQ
jgi:serine protease Do